MRKLMIVLPLLLLGMTAWGHGISAEDQLRILNAGPLEYIELGAMHMVTGYDHLLFIFAVIFHSITLLFATLWGIQANFYLIDAVIALTVCYKAFDNLDGFKKYLDMKPPNLMWMVFIFGLIHGFGLSTRLQELPLGDDSLVLKILSFNLGVELGQVAALSIMLVVLAGWRKTASFAKFSKLANGLLMALGALLLLMQLHSYQHAEYADDFPLNKDDHSHVHDDMRKAESGLSGYKKQFNFNQE
jgi:hydrogenase/urease accessory protein HupE